MYDNTELPDNESLVYVRHLLCQELEVTECLDGSVI